MIIDLQQEVLHSCDLRPLEAILRALVGQRCLKLEFSYGDELMLHVGEPLAYDHPQLADEQKGSWVLGTRASRWQLLLNTPPLLIESDQVDVEEVERRVSVLIGTTIVVVEVIPHSGQAGAVGLGLQVRFHEGSRLIVMPEPSEEDDLADWELFTPFHTYLRCGPGQVWSYLRSDVVAEREP